MKGDSEIDPVAVFGTDEASTEVENAQLGPFRVRLADGQIASIYCDGTEVCRGLTYLVRDRNWATLTAKTEVESRGDDAIVLRASVAENGAAFDYRIELALDHGDLIVTSRGIARCDFAANRIGFSFLHPTPDCTGQPVLCRHSDGKTSETNFPRTISPGQPIFDIVGLEYRLADDKMLKLDFRASRGGETGMAFEMEDQRNWGDASFKTYVGSLLDPWPFDVTANEVFLQTLQIGVSESPRVATPKSHPDPAHDEHPFQLPALGLNVPEGMSSHCLKNLRRCGHPKSAFLSVYLSTSRLSQPELSALADLAREIAVPVRIELEVHDPADHSLFAAADAIAQSGIAPVEVIACQAVHLRSYQPSGPWPDTLPLDTFFGAVRDAFPNAKIGGGALTYFPELNRLRPPTSALGFLGFGYCPIVHAADELTILQNVRTVHDMDATLAEHDPHVAWHILSAALSMRLNPYGDRPEPNPDRRRIAMSADDPRDRAEFGAYWRLCLLTALARTQVSSVCLGALAGPSSIFEAHGPGPTFEMLAEIAKLPRDDEEAFMAVSTRLCRGPLSSSHALFGPPDGWNIQP